MSDPSTEQDAASTSVVSPSGDDSTARILQLEEEVLAKDELVTALTVQLEQLAEQLDRLQRSGADKKRAGGLPADVVDNHRKMVGELERVVQQWEDMQAGMMLGRIEVQLSELRDFVAERLTPGASVPAFSASSSHPAMTSSVVLERISLTATPVEPPALEVHASGEPTSESPSDSTSMWESIKSRMLDEPPTSASEEVAESDVPVSEPPLPAPISPANSTPAELEAAIDQRDAYIAYLLRRTRQLNVVHPPPDWVSLEKVPEDLCQAFTALSKQLEEHLRLAEVEMSIERARIGREQSQLRQQQESIEKQMRRLGLKTLDDQVAEPEAVPPTDRRWVRFLGIPKNGR